MSANSTVDFPVCQQESAIKIVFSKVQFLDRGLRCAVVGTGRVYNQDGILRVLIMGLWCVTVQTGCYYSSLTAQSIHLREKSIAGPTERPKGFSLFGSQGSDQRFSMKMMFATYLRP